MQQTIMSSPAQMLKSWYIGFFQIPVIPEIMNSLGDYRLTAQALLQSSKPGTFSAAHIAEYIRAWKQPGAMTAMLNYYRAMGQRRDDGAFSANPRVTVPTIIIWGAQDRFLERGMAQESTTLCDDARVVYFEDATMGCSTKSPTEVNALLSEFFRQHCLVPTRAPILSPLPEFGEEPGGVENSGRDKSRFYENSR